MATVGESDSSLAAQCLDFCKALTSQGKVFQFSLNIGKAFSFTLDSRCKDSLVSMTKKKASPSTLRRNARRKEEFLTKKSKPAPEQEEVPAGKELTSQISTFQCDQCEKVFKQESGLKIHIGKTHMAPISPANSLVASSELPSFPRGDPAEKFGCNHCDNIFDLEKEMRLHNHEVHGKCRVGPVRGVCFTTPCAWPDCTTPKHVWDKKMI